MLHHILEDPGRLSSFALVVCQQPSDGKFLVVWVSMLLYGSHYILRASGTSYLEEL